MQQPAQLHPTSVRTEQGSDCKSLQVAPKQGVLQTGGGEGGGGKGGGGAGGGGEGADGGGVGGGGFGGGGVGGGGLGGGGRPAEVGQEIWYRKEDTPMIEKQAPTPTGQGDTPFRSVMAYGHEGPLVAEVMLSHTKSE